MQMTKCGANCAFQQNGYCTHRYHYGTHSVMRKDGCINYVPRTPLSRFSPGKGDAVHRRYCRLHRASNHQQTQDESPSVWE